VLLDLGDITSLLSLLSLLSKYFSFSFSAVLSGWTTGKIVALGDKSGGSPLKFVISLFVSWEIFAN